MKSLKTAPPVKGCAAIHVSLQLNVKCYEFFSLGSEISCVEKMQIFTATILSVETTLLVEYQTLFIICFSQVANNCEIS